MTTSQKAVELFEQGFNCAQAVLGAFGEQIGLSAEQALKISSAFGGGVGRQREICGALSGMLMAFSMLYGYDDAKTGDKAKLYEQTRALCDEFKKQNGSILCREILKNAEVGGTPEPRTKQYYEERPCTRCVRTAAEILEEYIKNQQ